MTSSCTKLTDRAKTLKVGDPDERDVYVGPVIDEQGRRAIRAGGVRGEGRNDPRRWSAAHRRQLRWATLSSRRWSMGLPAIHELFKRELFLPFMVVAPVDSLDEAICFANDTEYGLTAGHLHRGRRRDEQFFDDIEAGVVYANRRGGATTGAWPGCQSFCGWKASGSTGKGGLGPSTSAVPARAEPHPGRRVEDKTGAFMPSPVPVDVEYMVQATAELCRIPSPTGYTHLVTEHLEQMLGELGLTATTRSRARWSLRCRDRARGEVDCSRPTLTRSARWSKRSSPTGGCN